MNPSAIPPLYHIFASAATLVADATDANKVPLYGGVARSAGMVLSSFLILH
ncbi:MAG: hypothetical protein LBQ49_00405 [Rickettsiales bacterium]|nr:hypothetical protein [Rickettsiales bacterium]